MTKHELRGLRILTAPSRESGPMANYIVRIYYRSMADEILCCDSDLLSYQAASALKFQCEGREVQKWLGPGKGWKYERECGFASDAIDADMYKVRGKLAVEPVIKHGARLVKLPHQYSLYCADCGEPIKGPPIFFMGTSARCTGCHDARMTDDEGHGP